MLECIRELHPRFLWLPYEKKMPTSFSMGLSLVLLTATLISSSVKSYLLVLGHSQASTSTSGIFPGSILKILENTSLLTSESSCTIFYESFVSKTRDSTVGHNFLHGFMKDSFGILSYEEAA